MSDYKIEKIPQVKLVKVQPKSKEQQKREKILNKLKDIANWMNNVEAEDFSDFVPAKRPPENKIRTVANFGTCFKCKKTLSLTSLHKHVSKRTNLLFKDKHAVRSSSRATTGGYHPIASEAVIRIISHMREDDILDGIKFVYAIFLWLNAEASKYETASHLHNKVRSNLRRLARLLHHMKILNDEIQEFSDIFHENRYGDFIEACRILGNPDPTTNYMKSAATANDMSYLVKNVGNVYHVMLGDTKKQKREEIAAFLKKVEVLWHNSIGNTFAETQAKNRRNKKIKQPAEKDLILLREYLENEMLKAYNALRINYTDDDYCKLRNAIESYLHVTNCRRAGEVERLNLEEFNLLEIKNHVCRVQVRGKRKRPVPIIFDKKINKYLQLLLKNRKNARISKQNPYVFASIHDVGSNFKYNLACPLMQKFSEECGASDPATLRGTLFRQHFATAGMEQGIDENAVEQVCSYLGHTPKIHKQNYRQSIFDRDVSVSNLVQQAQTAQKNPPLPNTEGHEIENPVRQDQSIESIEENQCTSEKKENSINKSNLPGNVEI